MEPKKAAHMSPSCSVSIVVVTYNFASYIGQCLQSLVDQTVLPLEIIVHDDHSTDDSWKIIQKYQKRYPDLIRAYRQEKKLGVHKVSKLTIQDIRGDYLFTMDGDDYCHPEKIEHELATLQKYPDAIAAFSDVILIDATNSETKRLLYQNWPYGNSNDLFIQTLAARVFDIKDFIFRSELIRTDIYKKVFNLMRTKNRTTLSDYELKLKVTLEGPIVPTRQALTYYRRHQGGYSYSDHHSENVNSSRIQILADYIRYLDSFPRDVRNYTEFYIRWSLHHLSFSKIQKAYFAVGSIYADLHQCLQKDNINNPEYLTLMQKLSGLLFPLAIQDALANNLPETALKIYRQELANTSNPIAASFAISPEQHNILHKKLIPQLRQQQRKTK